MADGGTPGGVTGTCRGRTDRHPSVPFTSRKDLRGKRARRNLRDFIAGQLSQLLDQYGEPG